MARDDVEEPPALLGARVALRQRFDVAADGGQRRAQLVRDVGDEVAPDLIGAPQVGDVVQHEDGAVRAAAGRRRRARHDRARRVARRRELQRVGRPAGQRRGHQLGDRRMADRLDVVAAERQVVELAASAARRRWRAAAGPADRRR